MKGRLRARRPPAMPCEGANQYVRPSARAATAATLLPADRVESRDPHAGRADSRERIPKEM
jgi:hypothetical protein